MKIIKAGGNLRLLLFLSERNYSPGAIASDGQTLAHVPQSTQRSGLIEYFSPSEIASDGHSSMQVPHAMQSSLITYAIVGNVYWFICGKSTVSPITLQIIAYYFCFHSCFCQYGSIFCTYLSLFNNKSRTFAEFFTPLPFAGT